MTDRTQANSATHTPTPWRFDHDWHRLPTIFGADGYKLAIVEKDRLDEAKANAALIIEAVNNYASLKDRIAELEKNEKAYEEIIGKKTFQEVADRIRELEGDLRRSREKLINMAADCHRSKWQFDLNEDYRPTAGAARDLILKAFRELHRIGDVAIKAYSDLHPKDPAP